MDKMCHFFVYIVLIAILIVIHRSMLLVLPALVSFLYMCVYTKKFIKQVQ